MTAPKGSRVENGSQGFVRGLGLWDSTTLVAGSMIGSGIFIVSADISRQVGSVGGLLATWIITGLLTIAAALAYGELAAMMPKAGGQYVYLREAYSPMWGFLYGWTFFLVIQTGSVAAVAVGFARFLGVLAPWVSTDYVIEPVNVSEGYALSLSRQQLVAIAMIVLLSWLNTRGLKLGKLIQNVFTSAKTLALVALILLGLFVGANSEAIRGNLEALWTPRNPAPIQPGFGFLPTVSVTTGLLGIVIAFGVAQVGSLFSADAWNYVTFTAGEVKNPRRDIPLSMALGTGLVILLYVLVNLAYAATLPLAAIQNAPDDRVATAALGAIFGAPGATIMAIAIVVSTFGCNNGLILAGARVSYAMARDGLFFRPCGVLNRAGVPARGLWLQCAWASFLVLPRTRLYDATGHPLLDAATGAQQLGNLYSDLLDYVVFAILLFYVLTIAGLFRLRKKRPDVPRPYRAFGYPWIPVLYLVVASTIMLVLIGYRTQMTWRGLLIVLTGIPVYLFWRGRAAPFEAQGTEEA